MVGSDALIVVDLARRVKPKAQLHPKRLPAI
jgi:hypothetical protein